MGKPLTFKDEPYAGESPPLRAAAPDGDAVLPCDVLIAPATLITKGCKMSTLFLALNQRIGQPDDLCHITGFSASTRPIGAKP